MNKHNDLDLKNWKSLKGDITTDAVWYSGIKKDDGKFLIPKRDFLSKNDSIFHGIFIPEIPYQMIKRFTKENEIVWDCFGGSGTTYKVAKILNRKCIINDLTPTQNYIQEGDSRFFDPKFKVQLVILHPPYLDIVKYSNKPGDGSTYELNAFMDDWFKDIIQNADKFLDNKRFMVLVCGNIYKNGEELTLGVWLKDIICRNFNYKCKSHIIKDYGETKGGDKNYNLNYYRQLRGNYNNFYGDNIFILQKK